MTTDWKKELLESQSFNKFQEKLLKNGAKSFMESVYLGYLYTRWRKLKGLNLNDPKENTGQMQSSFKDFSDNVKKDS